MTCGKCKGDIPSGAVFCPWCGRKQTRSTKHRRWNNQGSVYKLDGHRNRPWCAVKDGVYIGYYDTKKAAVEALGRLTGVSVTERYNWSFAQVYEAWKQEHFPEIGQAGQEQYERAFDVFRSLHNKVFRELRAGDYQVILDRYADRSASTVAKYKQLLTQMGEFAIREEIATVNFGKFVKARGQESHGHEAMTEDEVSRIYAAADSGDETARLVCCLLSTGMRIGELFALRIADCHEDYVIGGEKTKAGRDRIIPIRQEGREHFAYFVYHADGDRLIDGYSGNRDARNFRRREYARLLDSLGIDRSKTPHSTRVTYTTQAVSSGVAPADLQKILGHANFDTTQRHYNKPTPEALVQAVEQKNKPGA